MTSKSVILGVAALLQSIATALVAAGAEARDRPFSTSKMTVRPVIDPLESGSTTGGGGQFSKVQIERYRCAVAAGSAYGAPAGAMDISCNDPQPFRQDFNPDNELAVAVNPKVPGRTCSPGPTTTSTGSTTRPARGRRSSRPDSSPRSTAARTWVDGQIPMRTGNGAGDPSPAFDARLPATRRRPAGR